MKFNPLLLLGIPVAVLAKKDGVKIFVRNDSEQEFSLSWVNPNNGKRHLMIEFAEDLQESLDSYIGHTFEVKEMGDCETDDICRVASLVVSKDVEQSFIVDVDFQVLDVPSLRMAPKATENPKDRLIQCRNAAKKELERIDPSDKQAQDQITKDFGACVKKGIATAIRKGLDQITFVENNRADVAANMENFTCTDPNLGSSPDVDTREWKSDKDGKSRTVHVKLARPSSRIHVIEDFAYKEECDAVQETASANLRQASTADGKGGSKISEARKAMQAAINPAWHLEGEGDLIARLSRRVYDYVNYELGMTLEEHGQEPLMSIQYFGRGYNDTAPDRYTPHCDGKCTGSPFEAADRMATMVIYCDAPSAGGHTNFQNANVHVMPEVGSAVFFSYFDPITNITDNL